MKDTVNLGFEGTQDSMNKLGFSMLYNKAKPTIHVPDLNDKIIDVKFPSELIAELEMLEKDGRINVNYLIPKKPNYGLNDWGLTKKSERLLTFFDKDFVKENNHYSFETTIIADRTGHPPLEKQLEENEFRLYLHDFLDLIRRGANEPTEKWSYETRNHNRKGTVELIKMLENEIRLGYFYSDDISSISKSVFKDLVESHLKMFNDSMATGEPVLANNLLHSAINALNKKGQEKNPDSKIFTPALSIQLPYFPKVGLKNIAKISETKQFETIRDELALASQLPAGEKGLAEAKLLEADIAPRIQEIVEGKVKMDPWLKKALTSPGSVWGPLIFALLAQYGDLQTFIANFGPAETAAAVGVGLGSAKVASTVEQAINRKEKRKLITTNETYVIQPDNSLDN